MNKLFLMLTGSIKPGQIDNNIESFINSSYQEVTQFPFSNKQSNENINRRQIIDKIITTAKNNLDTDTYSRFLLGVANTLAESELIHLAEEILITSLGDVKKDYYYAESLLALADIYIRKAYWINSLSLIKQAKEIFARINNVNGMARCENLTGILYGEKGDLIKSRAHFNTSKNLLDHDSDKKFIAQIESNMAIIENIIGNFIKAEKYFNEALINFEILNDLKNLADTRHNLGMFYFERKEYSKALIEFEKSIEIGLKENYPSILAISYIAMANTFLALKKYDKASEYAYMAMDTAIKIDDKLTIADVYRILGILGKKSHRFDIAESFFQTSIRLNDELDNKLNSAEASLELGLLFLECGQESEKNHWLQKSLKYYSGVGAVDKVKLIGKFLNQHMN